MKRIVTYTLPLIVSLFMSITQAFAQTDYDMGNWNFIQIIKSWDRYYAVARAEYRSCDKFSTTECGFAVVGAGYSFSKWLKGDLCYEFWKVPVAGNAITHKAVATVNGTLKRDALAVSLREKYELAFNAAGGNPSGTLRSRLRAQYSIESSAFTPYLMYECFNGFSGNGWQRSLHYVGTDIRLGAHSSLDVFYMFHMYPAGGVVTGCNVFGLGYVVAL